MKKITKAASTMLAVSLIATSAVKPHRPKQQTELTDEQKAEMTAKCKSVVLPF